MDKKVAYNSDINLGELFCIDHYLQNFHDDARLLEITSNRSETETYAFNSANLTSILA